jgi:hypothetical protein
VLTVELSDHPGDMLTAETRRREAAVTKARSAYDRRLTVVRQQRDEARRRRKWWTWLRLAFTVRKQKRGRPLLVSVPTDTEEIIKAGIAGERQVAAELGRALDDEWTLLHGYRNSRGEIDYLLLGPKGLFAIEVKNINATVRVDGDSWLADKYDRYGNFKERYLVTDRRGRSPSLQLNQPADVLAGFLHGRGQQVPVRRVVVLAHARSKLGQHTDLTVNVAITAKDILRIVRASPDSLDAGRRAEVRGLIQHDHAFHEKRRAGSRTKPRTRRAR